MQLMKKDPHPDSSSMRIQRIKVRSQKSERKRDWLYAKKNQILSKILITLNLSRLIFKSRR